MKRDLSELKKLVVDLVETNNLSIPRGNKLLNEIIYSNVENSFTPPPSSFQTEQHQAPSLVKAINNNATPFTINHQSIQETEDQLSLEDIEKDYILKALSKHKGRRRDAAAELGISERTLYRKIKEYQIKE
jgi:DNA-binding NtrC family response regulator